jgi:enamine deaminase RidA (YjgF/YER057c/UK114 family)
MKQILFILLLITASQAIHAQQPNIQKQKFHWGRDQDTTAGYAQAVLVDNVLYISGTVSRDITPEGVRNLYTNLERTLKHYGATFQHVVKENLYTTDIEAMKANNHVRKNFYNGDFPAATWVQISRLYMPDAKLEIELIAHLPQK